MIKELKKRIFTSSLLIIVAITCITINKLVFIFSILAVSLLCFIEWNIINKNYFLFKKKKKNKYIYVQLFGAAFLFIFILSALNLYAENGKFFFIFILFICACSDIGGYIFGKIIGGKKLIKISPNKTISGSFGSFVFSLIPILLINLTDHVFINFKLTAYNILICLFISLICQLGDLAISYFKRINKVKDTGNILPGHGGLLDRIDGIIFAIPTVYFLQIIQTL